MKQNPPDFPALTRAAFDPVAKEYGMRCVHEDGERVAYENERVSLAVFYDRKRSYELTLSISFLRGGDWAVSLGEILAFKRRPEAQRVASLQTADTGQLPQLLNELRDLAREQAHEFLSGIESAFTELAEHRREAAGKLEEDVRLLHARESATRAWEVRDYEGVVRALEPVESLLSPAEKSRLDYAAKQRKPS